MQKVLIIMRKMLPYIISLMQIPIVIICINNGVYLSETSMMYFSSTCAQVIAALFGLSVTGYIFFDAKLRTVAEDDDTISDIISIIIKDNSHALRRLSVLCTTAIVLCVSNILMFYKSSTNIHWTVLAIFYESCLFFILSVVQIMAFTWRVIDPNRIEEISNQQIKLMNSGRTETNNQTLLPEFLRLFNQIEHKVSQLSEQFSQQNHVPGRMLQNVRILVASEVIPISLEGKIDKLRKYRNYVVHGTEMIVNEENVTLATEVLAQLEAIQKKSS